MSINNQFRSVKLLPNNKINGSESVFPNHHHHGQSNSNTIPSESNRNNNTHASCDVTMNGFNSVISVKDKIVMMNKLKTHMSVSYNDRPSAQVTCNRLVNNNNNIENSNGYKNDCSTTFYSTNNDELLPIINSEPLAPNDSKRSTVLIGPNVNFNQSSTRLIGSSDQTIVQKEANSSLCVRRIMILHDNLQFDEANKFIDKLSQLTFSKVIKELPIGSLIATFPGSVKLLEIIYTRFNCLDDQLKSEICFNEVLQPDRLVINLVKLFALQKPIQPNGKGSNGFHKNALPLIREKFDSDHPVIIASKNILKIILIYKPFIRKEMSNRKASLDEALQGLSNHGLVGAVDQSLTSLHEALRLEISSVIDNYKDILLRLENLKESTNNSKRTAILRSISRATSRSSTARLNSMNNSNELSVNNNNKNQLNKKSNLKLEELQDRLISNQVILNAVEPITICNQPLQELILTLQQRINYDKQVLSQFNQLRKEFNAKRPRTSGSASDSVSSIFPVLSIFAFGYNQVLNLINEISTLDEANQSDDENEKLPIKVDPTIAKDEINTKVKQNGGHKGDDEVKKVHHHDENCENNSSLESTSPNNDFELNCQMPNKYNTIIHRSDYHKNRKMIPSLLKELKNDHLITANQLTDGIKVNGNDSNCLVKVNQSTYSSDDTIKSLKDELNRANKVINEMKEREQQLKDRLSDQAQKMLSKGWKLENLCFNETRPTALIRRYGNLYAQSRVDTLDALDDLKTLKNADDLKAKLLFSLVVLSFCSVEQSVTRIRQQIRKVLKIPADLTIKSQPVREAIDEVDVAITSYLRLSIDTFDPRNNVEEVLSQICATLYDYPCLRSCDGLLMYIKDCVTLAWALTVQKTPFTIEYGCRTFDDRLHIRFHTSDQSSNHIKSYLWPSLLEASNGPCVHKGVVIT